MDYQSGINPAFCVCSNWTASAIVFHPPLSLQQEEKGFSSDFFLHNRRWAKEVSQGGEPGRGIRGVDTALHWATLTTTTTSVWLLLLVPWMCTDNWRRVIYLVPSLIYFPPPSACLADWAHTLSVSEGVCVRVRLSQAEVECTLCRLWSGSLLFLSQ